MKQLFKFTFIIALVFFLFTACETAQSTTSKNQTIAGDYVMDAYFKRDQGYDWMAVSIKPEGNNVAIQIRSRADKKDPTCSLETLAKKVNDHTYQAELRGKKVLFTLNNQQLKISTQNPADESILYFYCSGGASLKGNYIKLKEDLDTTQLK